jgi:hypothetical protein
MMAGLAVGRAKWLTSLVTSFCNERADKASVLPVATRV